MQKLFRRPLVGLMFVSLCCTGMAWGQDGGATGAQLLPPSTRLMFSISDIPTLKKHSGESSLGQMLADPDFEPFLGQIKQKIAEASDRLNEEIGLSLDDLLSLPQGEITLAVVEQPVRRLNAVFLMNVGRNQETLDKLLGLMQKGLVNEGATLKTETVGAVEIQILEFPKQNDIPYNQIAYFTANSYLVMASDVAPLRSVIDRWDGRNDDTLANDQVFSYIMKKCTTGDAAPAVQWYLDLIGLTKSGIAMMQGQNPQAGLVLGVLPILGLDRLKGMGGGMDVAAGDFDSVSKTFIYAEQPPTGVLGVFQFPAIAQAPPKWVSSDATLYMGVNWDVNEAYLAVESLIDSFQGPGATAKLLDAVALEDNGPQIHPKLDLLDKLTGHLTVVTAPTPEDEDADETPAFPEVTIAMQLKDADGMKRTLDKASKSDGFPGRVIDVEGQVVYELPTDGEQNMSIAVIGKELVFAVNPARLSDVIRGEAANPLASSPEYAAIARHFPAQMSIVSFTQQDSQMKSVYELLKQQADGDFADTGIDLSKLPSYESLAKYAKPSGSYAVPDARGALFVGFTLAD